MLYIVDMNKKYNKYIDYIVNDIQLPYIKSIDQYGLKDNEYKLVLSKVFNQPVTIYVYNSNDNLIRDNYVYNSNDNLIYIENSIGSWAKKEYDTNGNEIYVENSDGYWVKKEYDSDNNLIYWEDSNGYIKHNR